MEPNEPRNPKELDSLEDMEQESQEEAELEKSEDYGAPRKGRKGKSKEEKGRKEKARWRDQDQEEELWSKGKKQKKPFVENIAGATPEEVQAIEAQKEEAQKREASEARETESAAARIPEKPAEARRYVRDTRREYEALADKLVKATLPGAFEREEVKDTPESARKLGGIRRSAKMERERLQAVLETGYEEAQMILDESELTQEPTTTSVQYARERYRRNYQRLQELLAAARKDALETGNEESSRKTESLQVMLYRFLENIGARLPKAKATEEHISVRDRARQWLESRIKPAGETEVSQSPESPAVTQEISPARKLPENFHQLSEKEQAKTFFEYNGGEEKMQQAIEAGRVAMEGYIAQHFAQLKNLELQDPEFAQAFSEFLNASIHGTRTLKQEERLQFQEAFKEKLTEHKAGWEANIHAAYTETKENIFDSAWNGRLGALMQAHERAHQKYNELNARRANGKIDMKGHLLHMKFEDATYKLEAEVNQEQWRVEKLFLAWLTTNAGKYRWLAHRSVTEPVLDPALRDTYDYFLAHHNRELTALDRIKDEDAQTFLDEVEVLLSTRKEEAETPLLQEKAQKTPEEERISSGPVVEETMQAPHGPEQEAEQIQEAINIVPGWMDTYIAEHAAKLKNLDTTSERDKGAFEKIFSTFLRTFFFADQRKLTLEQRASLKEVFEKKIAECKAGWETNIRDVYAEVKETIFDPAWNGRLGKLITYKAVADPKVVELGRARSRRLLTEKERQDFNALNETVGKLQQEIWHEGYSVQKSCIDWFEAHREDYPWLKDTKEESAVLNPVIQDLYAYFVAEHQAEMENLEPLVDTDIDEFLAYAESILREKREISEESTELNRGVDQDIARETKEEGTRFTQSTSETYPEEKERAQEEDQEVKREIAQEARTVLEGQPKELFQSVGQNVAHDMTLFQGRLEELDGKVARARKAFKEAKDPDTQKDYKKMQQDLEEERKQLLENMQDTVYGSLKDALDVALKNVQELRENERLRSEVINKVTGRLHQDVEGKAMDASLWKRVWTNVKGQLPITVAAIGASFLGRVNFAGMAMDSVLRSLYLPTLTGTIRTAVLGYSIGGKERRVREQEAVKHQAMKKMMKENPDWLKSSIIALITSELQKSEKLEDAVEAYFGHLSPVEKNTIQNALGTLQSVEAGNSQRAQGFSEPKVRVVLDFLNNYVMGFATGSYFSKKALEAKAKGAEAGNLVASSVIGGGLVYAMQGAGKYAVWGRMALLGALGQRIGSAVDRWVEQTQTRKAVESKVEYLKERKFFNPHYTFTMPVREDVIEDSFKNGVCETDYVLAKDLLDLYKGDPKFPISQAQVAEVENFVHSYERNKMEMWSLMRSTAESVLDDIYVLDKTNTEALERELGRKGMKREVVSAAIQLASTGGFAAVGAALPAVVMWAFGKKQTDAELAALQSEKPGASQAPLTPEKIAMQDTTAQAAPGILQKFFGGGKVAPSEAVPPQSQVGPENTQTQEKSLAEAYSEAGVKKEVQDLDGAEQIPPAEREEDFAGLEKVGRGPAGSLAGGVMRTELETQNGGETEEQLVKEAEAASLFSPEPAVNQKLTPEKFFERQAVLKAFGYDAKVDEAKKISISIEFGGKGPKHLEDALDGLGGQGMIARDIEVYSTAGKTPITEDALNQIRTLDALKAGRILNISQNILAAYEGRGLADIQEGLKASEFSIEGNKLSIQNYDTFYNKVLQPLAERASTHITPEGAEEGKFGALAFVDNVKKTTLHMLQEGMMKQTTKTPVEMKIPDFNEDSLVTKAEQRLFTGSAAEALKPLQDQGWEVERMNFSVGARAESFGSAVLKNGDQTIELGLDLHARHILGEGTGEALGAGHIVAVDGKELEEPIPLDTENIGEQIFGVQNRSIQESIEESLKDLKPEETGINPEHIQSIAKGLDIDTRGPMNPTQELRLTTLLTKHPFLDLYKTEGTFDPEKIKFIDAHQERTDDEFIKLFSQTEGIQKDTGVEIGFEAVDSLVKKGITLTEAGHGVTKIHWTGSNIDMTLWKEEDTVYASYVPKGSSASVRHIDPMGVDIKTKIENPAEWLQKPDQIHAKAQQMLSIEAEAKRFVGDIEKLQKNPSLFGKNLPNEYVKLILKTPWQSAYWEKKGFVDDLLHRGVRSDLPVSGIKTPLGKIQETLEAALRSTNYQRLLNYFDYIDPKMMQKATIGQILMALTEMKATGKVPDTLPKAYL
ncbi:MAG: hypothetical protein A3B74_04515 [Candidatus Kerfeldbacteria bacterium RIFCSPHIGHO2_02_FULL_42_14]|uniref:Uncharacterized protein n=1 Tax=Candidatus Kerfeldbacteria bacterium RIFCSPHIGHO2_02_FULL_42_14 TaxID=1798540 RepID=A0A1G2AQ44_9BACT|nr:MAG: hypothetical protein A3B74_04515 [Candidatus Kerfeldbacteria bacterium RIFCSPHIGHO2_02_FULL_42_14]OGY80802.1 MAG: hypothetical protein A3E60_01305 [Candidatus Kerfeldbacteria bacterium RIFCSPHIGHO2_12_FULL_42_13]OGY84973.1 MAG: hypothetical protein A3I91_00640 [Candidatus Kerfeldbacteria bacterium RIFCSPLOWO2_02_FULL_42_19]